MSGEAKKVDLLGLHINRQDSRRLGGVHKKDQAVGIGDGPHPANIHGVSCEVGGMGADDGPRLRADQPLKIAVVDPPLPVSRDETERHAPLRLQPVQRTQHGIVLQIRGDHMVAGVQQAAMAMFRASVELAVNTTWSGRGQLKNVASFSLVP